MPNPAAIDTPDYQRGVVSAQVLLAAVPAGSTVVTVGVPPNAESLIVVTPAEALATDVAVAGGTTGLTYVGRRLQPYNARSTDPTWVFDISAALDPTVIVSCAMVDALKWYVYSDSAVHMEATTPALTNNLTAQYAIPIPPNTAAGDHPPVELQWASAGSVPSNGTVLAAPPAGQRYRIFSATLAIDTVGSMWMLQPAGGGAFAVGCGAGAVFHHFGPSGLPMPTGAAITAYNWQTAGVLNASVTYTTETP